jgi:hypothetical protein
MLRFPWLGPHSTLPFVFARLLRPSWQDPPPLPGALPTTLTPAPPLTPTSAWPLPFVAAYCPLGPHTALLGRTAPFAAAHRPSRPAPLGRTPSSPHTALRGRMPFEAAHLRGRTPPLEASHRAARVLPSPFVAAHRPTMPTTRATVFCPSWQNHRLPATAIVSHRRQAEPPVAATRPPARGPRAGMLRPSWQSPSPPPSAHVYKVMEPLAAAALVSCPVRVLPPPLEAARLLT